MAHRRSRSSIHQQKQLGEATPEEQEEKMTKAVDTTPKDEEEDAYAAHKYLLYFYNDDTERRYFNFQYVDCSFIPGKMFSLMWGGVSVLTFVVFTEPFSNGAEYTKESFSSPWWAGTYVYAVVVVLLWIGMFIDSLRPYREIMHLAQMFIGWPPLLLILLYTKRPEAFTYSLIFGCMHFCMVIAQCRMYRSLFFVSIWPLICLFVITFSIPDYWDTHTKIEMLYWVINFIPLLLLSFLERQTRKSFAERERSVATIAEIEHKTIVTQRMIANFFPRTPTLDLLLCDDGPRSKSYTNAVIVITDIVGFTAFTARSNPSDVIEMLTEMFRSFDVAAQTYNVEKIATIGDSYCGTVFPAETGTDASRCVAAIRFSCSTFNFAGCGLELRVGVHIGDVVGVFVGCAPPKFDLFGPGIDHGRIMEERGMASKVHVSTDVMDYVGSHRFTEYPITDYGCVCDYWGRDATTHGVTFTSEEGDDADVVDKGSYYSSLRDQQQLNSPQIVKSLCKMMGVLLSNSITTGGGTSNNVNNVLNVGLSKCSIKRKILVLDNKNTFATSTQEVLDQLRRKGSEGGQIVRGLDSNLLHNTADAGTGDCSGLWNADALRTAAATRTASTSLFDTYSSAHTSTGSTHIRFNNNPKKDGATDQGGDAQKMASGGVLSTTGVATLTVSSSPHHESTLLCRTRSSGGDDRVVTREEALFQIQRDDELYEGAFDFSLFFLTFNHASVEKRFQQDIHHNGITYFCARLLVVVSVGLLLIQLNLQCTSAQDQAVTTAQLLTLTCMVLYIYHTRTNHRFHAPITFIVYNVIFILAILGLTSECGGLEKRSKYVGDIAGCYLCIAIFASQYCLGTKLVYRFGTTLLTCTVCVVCMVLRSYTIDDGVTKIDPLPICGACFVVMSFFPDYSLRSAFQTKMKLRRLQSEAKSRGAAMATSAMAVMLPTFVTEKIVSLARENKRLNEQLKEDIYTSYSQDSSELGDIDFNSVAATWEYPHAVMMFAKFHSDDPEFTPDAINLTVQAIEDIIKAYGVMKVKTIGSTVMFVTDIDDERTRQEQVSGIVDAAIMLRNTLFTATSFSSLVYRIGIHCGPCFGAVIGGNGAIFDLFGDTVNTSSRMCSNASPNKIQMSAATASLLVPRLTDQVTKGTPVVMKGKGEMEVFIVNDNNTAVSDTSQQPSLLDNVSVHTAATTPHRSPSIGFLSGAVSSNAIETWKAMYGKDTLSTTIFSD